MLERTRPTSERQPLIRTTSARPFGSRIDYFASPRDLRGGKASALGVLADDVLVPGEINAERLVIRHIALDPLNVRAEAAQGFIGRSRGRAEGYEPGGSANRLYEYGRRA